MMTHVLPPNFYGSNINLTGYDTNNISDTGQCTGLKCHSHSFFTAATAVTILLAVLGAFGNILTVLAILTSRLSKNINSILICNLSAADAIYCTVILPLQALTFHQQSWTLGAVMCELHASLRIWLIGVNMTLLSCIAFYRFLHVVRPQSHTRLSQRPWFPLAVFFCWALPFLFAFAPIVKLWGKFSFEERVLQCTFETSESKSHKIATVTIGYVVPCVFISVCYFRIGCVVFNSRKRSSRGSIYRKQRAKRDSFRLTAMMVLIFVGFLVGTTPYFLINTVDAKLRYPTPHIWSPVAAWLMYILNPVIYTVMDVQFQTAYRKLLLCQVSRQEMNKETSIGDRQTSLLASTRQRVPEKTAIDDKI